MSRSPRWMMLVILVAACACEEKVAPAAGGQVEVRIGGDPEEAEPELAFTITRIYRKQHPTKTAPFHEDGGAWVYFDAMLVSDPKVTFTVGAQSAKGDQIVAFGDAVIVTPNREAGRGFVAAFAKAFDVTNPVEAGPGTLAPLQLATAVLGTEINRQRSGFGGRGTWTATKWFPALGGIESEIFFNYDLVGKRGEFSAKDADYNADVLAVFATALRDGLPPPRTSENDPTVATSGPTFADLKPVGTGGVQVEHLGSTAMIFKERRKDGDALVSLDFATGKTTDLAHVARSLDQVICLDWKAPRCLLRETMPEDPSETSSEDPSRYWFLERGELIAILPGLTGKYQLADAPLSPDGRYVALRLWTKRKSGNGASASITIFDRKTGKTQQVRDGDHSLELIGWAVGRAMAEVERGFPFDPPEERAALELELGTGRLTPAKRELRSKFGDLPNPRSPDGRRAFRIEGTKLVVTDVASKKSRTLEFQPADHRWVETDSFAWVSPRYLTFHANRMTLVDTDTMQLSFPQPEGDRSLVQFSDDFQRVLVVDVEGAMQLGRVVLPDPAPRH